MGTLVRKIAAESSIGYGVNILEVTPPGRIGGVRTNVVGVVADLPWGPVNEVTRITTAAQLLSTFCPEAFAAAADYVAMRAFLNKVFPGGLRVVRIDATDAATATSGDVTAGTGTIEITAKYQGALGNSISYQFVAATDSDAAKRDLIITIGTKYSARYKNLTFGTVADVDDPYVDIAAAAPSAMPAVMGSATALTTGADGTAVAADYNGSSSSNVGIRMFYGESVEANVLFVAECPSALIDSVNGALESYVQEAEKGMAVLCTVNGQTASAAETYVADYHDDRLVYAWPRVETRNAWDDGDDVEVDGNAFVAAAIAAQDPWVSPGGQPGAASLVGITGLETEASRIELDELKAAGVACFFIDNQLGVIIRGGVTTSITSGLTLITRRRMTDYITESIASRAVSYLEKPLDLNLDTQALGENTSGFIGEVKSFLEGLKTAGRIHSYSVDAFSGNTSDDLEAGRWYVLISVRLFAGMMEIVLKAAIGESVDIAEAA